MTDREPASAPDTRAQRRVTLFVVVVKLRDARRRKQVYELLAFAGQHVGVGTYEVATTAGGVRRLLSALGQHLEPEDKVRCYPVCKKCRHGVKMHGGGRLATLPVCFVL